MNMRFIGGLIVGVLLVVLFGGSKPASTHYHANFALYVNGAQDKFENFTFYEEVASCSGDEANNPKHRAHLHDKNNHTIHVHSKAVTWAQFFANLGYGLTDKSLTTDSGVFVDGQNGSSLTYILNGNMSFNVANRVINSEDTLLINYGGESLDTLFSRYDAIPKDAREFNTKADPASCSGQ